MLNSRGGATARLLAIWGLLILILAMFGSLWVFYQRSGRTPAEILDYVDRRLEGHSKIVTVTAPALSVLRWMFGAIPRAERYSQPFFVPPPPVRRGLGQVSPPGITPRGVRIWRVGPMGPLTRIADAAREAKDGDVVEIESGDYYGDVAIWEQKRLTIRGVGGAARIFANGVSAEGKAIWVIRHGYFDISNIDFIGATVADGNGAGIRFEGGHLRVRDCLFWDNETGILTAGKNTAADAVLEVENSEFAYSHVKDRWAHNLYVGSIASVTVTGSYFHHADRGHLLKSRARVSNVLYNRLTDESGGRASYELNFPNGGLVRVVGNIVQQQPGTENSTIIAYGEEGYHWHENRLYIGANTLVNDHPHGGTFVHAVPGVEKVVTANNLLVGSGVFRVHGDHISWNDVRTKWDALIMPSRQDYRLRETTGTFSYRPPPDQAWRQAVIPRLVYVHSRTLRNLPGTPLSVGASQEEAP